MLFMHCVLTQQRALYLILRPDDRLTLPEPKQKTPAWNCTAKPLSYFGRLYFSAHILEV